MMKLWLFHEALVYIVHNLCHGNQKFSNIGVKCGARLVKEN